MKRKWLILLMSLLVFSACNTKTEKETTEAMPVTDPSAETEMQSTEEVQTETEQTETQTETTASDRLTQYEVDFSDIADIRSLTVGHADDDLYALALISPSDNTEQSVVLYEIRGSEKQEIRNFVIPGPVERIGAITGDDDDIVFTAVDRADENTPGRFVIYKLEADSGEVHALYEGIADRYNYGQNLVADDDVVAFTENMTENNGLFFADVCLLKDDAKQIVNVEVFPAEFVSLLLDDDTLHYAAARDDRLFLVVYNYEEQETAEYAVEGDNAAFRLTDHDDDVFLLDNYNSHPDIQGSMMLMVRTGDVNVKAYAEEGRNIHSGIFADDGQINAVSSLSTEVSGIHVNSDLSDASRTGGPFHIPEGMSLTGVFEEDDAVIRYPKPVSEEGYTQFMYRYLIQK